MWEVFALVCQLSVADCSFNNAAVIQKLGERRDALVCDTFGALSSNSHGHVIKTTPDGEWVRFICLPKGMVKE